MWNLFNIYIVKFASLFLENLDDGSLVMALHTTLRSDPPTAKNVETLLRVRFEPTPFRTRTLIWRLRPTRPSQLCDNK
ncbi:hypothetical protein VNO77_07042 [Canavalia gladiata]|uniref:Uncharacterized protein n=1 Tax=Canavalia gladiata TaxID=3824 RepID=A0AAN9M792_CANGL